MWGRASSFLEEKLVFPTRASHRRQAHSPPAWAGEHNLSHRERPEALHFLQGSSSASLAASVWAAVSPFPSWAFSPWPLRSPCGPGISGYYYHLDFNFFLCFLFLSYQFFYVLTFKKYFMHHSIAYIKRPSYLSGALSHERCHCSPDVVQPRSFNSSLLTVVCESPFSSFAGTDG